MCTSTEDNSRSQQTEPGTTGWQRFQQSRRVIGSDKVYLARSAPY